MPLGLIGYGRILVPATNTLSVAGAALVVVLYAIIRWAGSRRIREKWPTILSSSAACGIFAGFIFVSEVVLEYILLPADNTRMGFVEFGLVLLIYILAAAYAAASYRSVGAGAIAAAAAAMVSSLIWFVAVLAAFYCFYESPRQELVFRAEGNYEDFALSGMNDFRIYDGRLLRCRLISLASRAICRGGVGCHSWLHCDVIPCRPPILTRSSVPMQRLGAAHSCSAGLPCRLQGPPATVRQSCAWPKRSDSSSPASSKRPEGINRMLPGCSTSSDIDCSARFCITGGSSWRESGGDRLAGASSFIQRLRSFVQG